MSTQQILELIAKSDPKFTVGNDTDLQDLVNNDEVFKNLKLEEVKDFEGFCRLDSRYKIFCNFIATDPSVTHLEFQRRYDTLQHMWKPYSRYKNWFLAQLVDAILKSSSIKHLIINHVYLSDFDKNPSGPPPEINCFEKLLQIISKPSLTTLGLQGITNLKQAHYPHKVEAFWKAIKDNRSLISLDFSNDSFGLSHFSSPLDLKVLFEGIAAKKKLASLNLRSTRLNFMSKTSFGQLLDAIKCVHGSLDLSDNDFSKSDGTSRFNLQQLFDAIIAGGLNSLKIAERTRLGELDDASWLKICEFIKGTPLKPCPLTHLELPPGAMLWYRDDKTFRRNIWEKFVEAVKASSICSMPGLKLDEIEELSDKDRSDFDAILTHNRFKQALASADAVVSRKPVEVGGKDKEGNYIKESVSVPIAKTILSMLNMPNMREHNLKLVDAVSNRRVTKKATYGEQKKDEDVGSRADFKASRESVSAAVSEALKSVSASLDSVASTGEGVSASLDSVASTGESVSASLDSVASTGTNDFSACQSTSSLSQSTSSTLGQEIPRCGL